MTTLRKRWLVAALFVACVPATEETDPRGGVIARFVPSAETTGRPFQSSDGWTVTIDRFAFRGGLFAERPIDQPGVPYVGGSGTPRILGPSEACEVWAVAVSVGPAEAYVVLQPRYSDFDDTPESVCGVDAELLTYFERRADSVFDALRTNEPPSTFRNSPSLVVLGHAEKAGRSIRLELVLDASSFGGPDSRRVPTTIVANQGALIHIGIDAAALFLQTGPETVAMSFDAIAAADKNADGIVTGAELGAAKSYCYDAATDDGDPTSGCDTLLSDIASKNVTYLFGQVPNSPK